MTWVAVGGIVAVAGPGAKQDGEGWRRARLPGREVDKDGGDGGQEERKNVGYMDQLLCHSVHPFWCNERQVIFHGSHKIESGGTLLGGMRKEVWGRVWG